LDRQENAYGNSERSVALAGNNSYVLFRDNNHLSKEEIMSTNALLIELLLSGFFAIACFKARAGNVGDVALRPRDFLRLTDRLERLRRTRWQWFAMVLVIVAVRLQSGVPLIIELTAALQFIIFLSLPTQTQTKGREALSRVRQESLPQLPSRRVSRGKA